MAHGIFEESLKLTRKWLYYSAVKLMCYNRNIWSLPPCAKQTFNLGNLSKTPPNIIEQIAMVVSDGMPEKEKKQQNVVRLFSGK